MGLGPTICCRCQVFALRDANNDDRCPACGKNDDLEYLWMFTEEHQEKVLANSKFYRFVLGEDAPPSDS